MSSAKVHTGVPVSTTTTVNKLSNGKFVASSSKPVQETVVSSDVGTTTDHHLPNTPDNLYYPAEDDSTEETAVQTVLAFETAPVFDDSSELFANTVALTAHETLRHISTYETNMEKVGVGVKKSTKAFG